MINLWEELHTDRLLLRRIEFEDVDFIFKHFGDEEVCKYMVDNEPVKTIDEAKDIIVWSHGAEDSPNNNRWLMVLKSTNEPIGTIGFHRWNRSNHSAEIGYDLSKAYWRQGFTNEAMTKVLQFGFERMGLNRIEAFAHIENVACYSLLRKHRFCCEGIIRDMYLYRGKYHDHYLMSLLAKDYQNGERD